MASSKTLGGGNWPKSALGIASPGDRIASPGEVTVHRVDCC
ncbi:hypothetical protein A2U01_0081823 [Trifolium medium]|uniref:Uncharacterized protein n=1 Tax=Trifolium medium TaxID=97028 RepID=A0A392TJG1_9FABA|nr:hypothetical protein [Trifolium medium]